MTGQAKAKMHFYIYIYSKTEGVQNNWIDASKIENIRVDKLQIWGIIIEESTPIVKFMYEKGDAKVRFSGQQSKLLRNLMSDFA